MLSVLDAHARLTLFQGQPYPVSVGWLTAGNFRWNALDVLCTARRPLDLVFLEPGVSSLGIMEEWYIIEEICQPRWVVLECTSLPHHTGWILSRLQAQPRRWAEMFRGHHLLSDVPWSGWGEVSRTRGYAVFARLYSAA